MEQSIREQAIIIITARHADMKTKFMNLAICRVKTDKIQMRRTETIVLSRFLTDDVLMRAMPATQRKSTTDYTDYTDKAEHLNSG